uniref:RNA exonuclease 4 n=1 Tax=Lepeophtheirus salmonis TaxID=72036 RepID=D3PK31_LEPSM|nr:RNA exonuclease 4 [Lepeophtheirus salmonis]
MSKKLVKKKFKKKPKETSSAKIPSSSKDYSSNWLKLSASLIKSTSKTEGKKHTEPNCKLIKKIISKKPPIKEAKPKPDIWFDDVDMELLDPEDRPKPENGIQTESGNTGNISSEKSLVKNKSFEGLTKIIGMDCEMVGVGFNGARSILARASIVNHFGKTIYDKFVKPSEKVTDYRTDVSGIRPKDIAKGIEFKVVQEEISEIIKGRILVGHAIKHDLKVLYLSHPKKYIRDTSIYKPFRKIFDGRTPSLKKLTATILSVNVQEGEHSPVEDARAAVRLYTMHRKEWENSLKKNKSEKKQTCEKTVKSSSNDRAIYVDSSSDSNE